MLMFRFSVAFMIFVLVSTVLWIYYCLYLFRALLCSDGYWTSSSLLRLRLVEEGITRKPFEYDGVTFCCVLVLTGFPMVPILPMTLSRATLRLLLFVDRRVESTFHLNTVQIFFFAFELLCTAPEVTELNHRQQIKHTN